MTVIIFFRGWPANLFENGRFSTTVTDNLERALPAIKKEMASRALEALPQGGVMMTIGNKSVNALIGYNYRSQNGDEILIIRIIAGG